MFKKILTERFFNENLDKGVNPQYLFYMQIENPELINISESIVRGLLKHTEVEAKRIQQENNIDELLRMLQGDCNVVNYEILHKKVLVFEDEIIPKIIKILINTDNDAFIEHASSIFTKCKRNYTNELIDILDDIKNLYAVSLICITLGFIGDEKIIPILYKKYLDLKDIAKNETYEQGALLGLKKLKERFLE